MFNSGSEVVIDVWFGSGIPIHTYMLQNEPGRATSFSLGERVVITFQRNEKNETTEERVNGVGSRPATNTSVGSLSS